MAEEWSRSSLLSLPGVLLPLVWITIFTRLYIKRCILKLVTMDDWVMVIAATLFTANCALYIIMSLSGWAEHQDTLAENQVAFVLELFYASELLYILCMLAVKCSVGVLLYRLAMKKILKWLIIGNIVWFAVIGTISGLVATFQCWPVRASWDRTYISPECIEYKTYTTLSILYVLANTVTDLFFATLPVYMVWTLRMDSRTKASVIFVLSLGYLTVLVAIVRFPYTNALAIGPDNTYTTVPIQILSITEIALGIIAGSLATFRPLLRRLSPWKNSRNTTTEETPDTSQLHSYPVVSKARTESKPQHDLCHYPHLSSVLQDFETPYLSNENVEDYVSCEKYMSDSWRSVRGDSTSSAEEGTHVIRRTSTVDTSSCPRSRQASMAIDAFVTPLTPCPATTPRLENTQPQYPI